jgi:spore germination cell wall hydrolase CwlJ-like protein
MKRLLMSFCVAISLVCGVLYKNCNNSEAYAAYYKPTQVESIKEQPQKPVVASKSPQKERQVECLADNIYHESKGESYTGKVAVGFVTLNRTMNESFPDNVCEVVKHKVNNKYQFSWLREKKKKKESQRPLVAKINDEVYNESKKIAENLYDNHENMNDPTKGSLYFHANYVKVKVKGKRVKTVIGQHTFYNIKKA